MSTKIELETIYVQLDALLDTRLGTLAKLGSEHATAALTDDYFTRRIDDFPSVKHEEFMKAYAKRDVEVLQMSLPTSVFLFLHTCIRNVIQDVVRAGNNPGFKVTVNYFPYDLQDEEVQMMKEVIEERLLGVVEVEMVNISDKDLTPSRVRKDFAMMVRYDFEAWLMQHVTELEKTQMPSVSLIAPALFQKLPSKTEEADLKAQGRDPLRDTEISLAPFIRLTYLDVAVFSLDQDIVKRKLDGIKETPAEAKVPDVPSEEIKTVQPKSAPTALEEDPDFPLL